MLLVFLHPEDTYPPKVFEVAESNTHEDEARVADCAAAAGAPAPHRCDAR